MFEVTINHSEYYYCKFVFKFESLEEAQKFVESLMGHFVKEEKDKGDMLINIRFDQRFTTEKEEEATEDLGI